MPAVIRRRRLDQRAGLFQAWARSGEERWGGSAWPSLAWQRSCGTSGFPVLHQGQIKGGEHLRDYRLLTGPLTGLALAYQVVWLVGEPGLRLWSATTDIRIFLVLDLLSDVGLGLLSVTLIERLSKHVPAEPGETSVAAAARLAE